MIPINSCFKSLSSAFVGSSKISILDGLIRPLIILIIIDCPPDTFAPREPASLV